MCDRRKINQNDYFTNLSDILLRRQKKQKYKENTKLIGIQTYHEFES